MKGNTGKAAEFISRLLFAAPVIHMLHLKAKGTGSFAEHLALGEVYDALPDLVDDVIEAWQGDNQLITSYPVKVEMCDNAYMCVSGLYDYVAANRKSMGSESHIQAGIDTILSCLAKGKYKLKNLK